MKNIRQGRCTETTELNFPLMDRSRANCLKTSYCAAFTLPDVVLDCGNMTDQKRKFDIASVSCDKTRLRPDEETTNSKTEVSNFNKSKRIRLNLKDSLNSERSKDVNVVESIKPAKITEAIKSSRPKSLVSSIQEQMKYFVASSPSDNDSADSDEEPRMVIDEERKAI